jgi:hypothetical protein
LSHDEFLEKLKPGHAFATGLRWRTPVRALRMNVV